MHPSALKRAQSEVRTAFKKAEDITLRAVSRHGSLPFLNAVIEETLRCYPSIPSTLPRITGDNGSIIDGCFVPPNVSTHYITALPSKEDMGKLTRAVIIDVSGCTPLVCKSQLIKFCRCRRFYSGAMVARRSASCLLEGSDGCHAALLTWAQGLPWQEVKWPPAFVRV
jgi:hypothetical protein